MDLWDLFFGAGPAVHTIMKLGFMPKDEDFLELTEEQYRQFFEKEGFTDEKIYALLPKNPQHYVPSDFNELNICTESDIATMKRGWQIVESYCSKSNCIFSSDKEKLAYAASLMPDVFSKGTPFEHSDQTHLKIAHINSQIDNDKNPNKND